MSYIRSALFFGLVVAGGLLNTSRGQTEAESTSREEATRLPAFKVTEPHAGDFLIQWSPRERNLGETQPMSPPTRMWLLQWPRPKTARNSHPDVKTSLVIDAAYRGRGLKDGDEIVRIAGKLLTEMKPGECLKLFRDPIRDP